MALIRMEDMNCTLTVSELRTAIKERRGDSDTLNLTVLHERSGINVHFCFKEGDDRIVTVNGRTLLEPTKKFIEGLVWYKEDEKFMVIGNLCDMRDGVQALSLQKHPRSKWMPEARYRAFDLMLVEGLKALFPVLFDEHEFEFSDADDGSSDVSRRQYQFVVSSYFRNTWYGERIPEDCTRFERAKGKLRICSNCSYAMSGCADFEALKDRAIKKSVVRRKDVVNV